MDDLTKLINIGKVAAEKLAAAGIRTPQELRTAGSVGAILRVRATSDPGACCSMLYALEGAIRGVRWHDLPREERERLRKELEEAGKRNLPGVR